MTGPYENRRIQSRARTTRFSVAKSELPYSSWSLRACQTKTQCQADPLERSFSSSKANASLSASWLGACDSHL